MQMKRFMMGALLTSGLVLSLGGSVLAASYTVSDSFTNRQTDFRSGVNGVSFLQIPTFDSTLGTLQSVQITYSVTSVFDVTLRNNNTSTTSSDTARIQATSNIGAFLVENGNVGGQFNDPIFNASGDFNPNTFGASASSTPQTFTLNGQQSTTFSQSVSASGSGFFTPASNSAVVNFFTGTGNIIPVGTQSRTFTDIRQSGGNFTATQVTTDTATFSVEYTYQPVPAPPAAVSLGIGSVIGMVGTGMNRLRRRTKRK